MAQIDVKANVGQAKQGIEQVDKAIDNAARTADRANKKQYRPLAPGSLEELREAIKLMERMATLSGRIELPGAPAPGAPQSPAPPPPSRQPREPRDQDHRGRYSNYGQYGTSGRFFNAFSSSMGGGFSTVAGEALSGAGRGGGFSGAGLLRGGLIGAGLFGALKAGQSVNEGMDNAKTLATDMDKLKRNMGDVGVSFNTLQEAAFKASERLEVNAVEAGKLMQEFNRLSGGVKSISDLTEGTRTGTGLAKALGLDPSQGVGFIAGMRQINGGGSNDGDRKLALMIGDVVTRSGMNARADDVLQAIQNFASVTSRISMTAPNVGGFGGMYAGMVGARIPGMTPEVAAAMLGQANSAMTNMGAYGEASETFTLSALGKYGSLNPIQARVLSEGGLFGNRSNSFGKGSAYRRYMMQEGKSESDIDGMIGQNGGVTNMTAIRKQLDSMKVDPEIKAEMAKNFFGLSSISQAMAMMTIKPEEMGKTEKLLGARGLNISDYNESGITTLSGIANDLMGRKGKGSLSGDEKNRLAEAISEADKKGGDAGFKLLQDTLADLAEGKDKQETLGSQMLDQSKRLETAMTGVGQAMLGPLTDMKELLMAGLGMSEGKARSRVLDIRKSEINDEFNGKRRAIDEDFQSKVGKLEGNTWHGTTDEYKDANKRLQAERNQKMQELEEGRKKRLDEVDSEYAKDTEARAAARQAATGSQATVTKSKQEFIDAHRAGAEAAGKKLGVDPKLLLAQAGLETGWGKSVIPGTNNLGNIKAGKSWKGDTKTAYDKAEGSNDAYRAYGSTEEYWKDYAGLIKRKYPGVIGAGSDSSQFAKGLVSGGYATDPNYESKIIGASKGIDLGPSNTPIPYGNPLGKFSLRSGVQNPVMINGEFRLIGDDNMPKALPMFISKEVPLPMSTGTR